MPKRRRLLTPMKKKSNQNNRIEEPKVLQPKAEKEVSTARGRFKGALLDALDPPGEGSDTSVEPNPSKRDRHSSYERQDEYSEGEERLKRMPHPRQCYVLKLFDRSVDLSQFEEDTPLYPICRAWIANQPKADYSKFGKNHVLLKSLEEDVELPGPQGPPVSRIPELLPEQKARSKDNINLNYREAAPPTREQLLQSHAVRWASVRQAWVDQASKVEERYEATQNVLNKMTINNGFSQV